LSSLAKPTGRLRWVICGLLFTAVVLSYVDRLVVAVLKPYLAHRYGWTETGYADLAFYFQFAYGLSYVVSGRLIDKIGARLGYSLAVSLWTVGHMLHAVFTSTAGMVWARLPLAIGEAATFPAALAAAGAWFPRRERALAIGIFNAGSNVGAIVTPVVVPWIATVMGWRMAFVLTGGLSIVWLVAWLTLYREPKQHPKLTPQELAWITSEPETVRERLPFRTLLRMRQTWAYMAGRFLIDPVWWTFLFWLPDFFNRQFGVNMMNFGPPLVVVYLLADLGSISGGWLSSHLLARHWSLNRSRKTGMLIASLCAVPIAFAADAPGLWWAVGLIGLACAGHQAFSCNLYALPGDLLPRSSTGSIIGLGGLAGAAGGMLMARSAGAILQAVGSYRPIFWFAASTYLLALLVVHLILPRYQPAQGVTSI